MASGDGCLLPRPLPPYPEPGIVSDRINHPRRTIRHDGFDNQDMFQRSAPGTDPDTGPLAMFDGIRLHDRRHLCIRWKGNAVHQDFRRGERLDHRHQDDECQRHQGLIKHRSHRWSDELMAGNASV